MSVFLVFCFIIDFYRSSWSVTITIGFFIYLDSLQVSHELSLLTDNIVVAGAKREIEDRIVPRSSDADVDVKSDDESDDDEDDTEALLAELEQIKKEKAEEKLRKERQEQEEELEAKETELLRGNPLLNNQPTTFSVMRRWDDDVVFKNQARGEMKATKRFVNDTIRNDFHMKFLQKYMK
ncbi:protein CWC15 [Capsicum chacoense]